MEQKINTHGGKRRGAGPPFKYGEDTCNITLRVPKSKKEEIKRLIYQHLEQYKSKRTDDYGC
jgi:hypothetical protein